MTEHIRAQPGIMEISPYGQRNVSAAVRQCAIKLSSNENPHGPSPKALEAIAEASGRLSRYPSHDHSSLRGTLAEVHGLDPERIVCGSGSDEIIALLCQAFAGPGLEVVYTEHGFEMYRISSLAAGATPVMAPETDRRIDVDSVLRAINERTRLVFIANPSNPTGTMLDEREMAALARGVPNSAILVIDGAYAEYVDGYEGGKSLVEARRNVVMTRTFSKIYGLGGLRVGWGYGSQFVVEALDRVRGPFNLGVLALAGAEAAARDQGYIDWSRRENLRLRESLAKNLAALGYPSDESFANFVCARCESAVDASALHAFLIEKGILVRKIGGYNLPAALRITVGTQGECEALASAVSEHGKARLEAV